MKKRHVFRNIILLVIIVGAIYYGYNFVQNNGGISEILSDVGSKATALADNWLSDDNQQPEKETNQNTNASTKAVTSKEDQELLKDAVTYTVSKEDKENEFESTSIDGLKIYQYGKTLLNSNEKEVYVQIQKALKDITPKIKIDSVCDYKTFSKVYSYVVQDHSEVYYLDKCKISYLEERGKYQYILELTYHYDGNKSVIEQHNKEISEKAKTVLSKANTLKTDYKKEKYIHDYIIKNCKYDKEAANHIDDFSESKGIYGVLINNQAICGGYSSAFHVLLSSVEIKSIRVIGEAQGGAHAWNIASIDGKWKYVDTTFDDPISVDQNGKELNVDSLQHTYFNYTDGKAHTLYEFNADDPFQETSGNYLSLPKVS